MRKHKDLNIFQKELMVNQLSQLSQYQFIRSNNHRIQFLPI